MRKRQKWNTERKKKVTQYVNSDFIRNTAGRQRSGYLHTTTPQRSGSLDGDSLYVIVTVYHYWKYRFLARNIKPDRHKGVNIKLGKSLTSSQEKLYNHICRRAIWQAVKSSCRIRDTKGCRWHPPFKGSLELIKSSLGIWHAWSRGCSRHITHGLLQSEQP